MVSNTLRHEEWFPVLGAPDPEHDRMKILLKEQKISFTLATVDGVPVHPGNAYEANGVLHPIYNNKKIIFIECSVKGLPRHHLIDHHNDGDPGYNMGPDKFWEASSLGQLYDFFSFNPIIQDDKILAALDHCPHDAMQGNCPGIDAGEVLQFSIAETARRRGLPVDQVKMSIKLQERLLESLLTTKSTRQIGRQEVICPQIIFGEGYSLEYIAAQTAAFKKGFALLVMVYETKEKKRIRNHLCGAVTKETVRFFQSSLAEYGEQESGCVYENVYGNEDRRYAGFYIRDVANQAAVLNYLNTRFS